MASVLLTQPAECDKFATIIPNRVSAVVEDPTNELGPVSARIYLEHIYFDLPVLDYPAVLRSCKVGETPFPKGSLLHHALLASALPWLDRIILARHGFSNRVEAFERNFHDLEVRIGPGVCCWAN